MEYKKLLKSIDKNYTCGQVYSYDPDEISYKIYLNKKPINNFCHASAYGAWKWTYKKLKE